MQKLGGKSTSNRKTNPIVIKKKKNQREWNLRSTAYGFYILTRRPFDSKYSFI